MNYRRLAAYAAMAFLGCGAGHETDIPCSIYGQWKCIGNEASYCNGAHLYIIGRCDSCQVSSLGVYPGVECANTVDPSHGRSPLLNLPGLPCHQDGSPACSFELTSKLTCWGGTYEVASECSGGQRCGLEYVRPGVYSHKCL